MDNFSGLYMKLNLAVTSALSDVFLIGGIAAINYGAGLFKSSLLPNVPQGYPRNIVGSGFDATTDIAKFILFDMSIKHGLPG